MLRVSRLSYSRAPSMMAMGVSGGQSLLRRTSAAAAAARPSAAVLSSMRSAPSSTCATVVSDQQRGISWGGAWDGVKSVFKVERSTPATKEQLVEEMPEIFEQPPVEIDDYIRPEKTMFESLEDWWDWILGFMNPIEKQVDAMQHLHSQGLFFGLIPPLSWGATFLLYGAILRVVTLIPSLYTHRNSLRLQQISTPLNEIQQHLKRVKADKTLTSEERKTVTAGYKRMKTALEAKAGASQMRSIIQVATAPVMMTAFWAIGRMTSYEQSLETADFLWVHDLSMPDPTLAFPIMCAATFVLNFELTQRLQKGARGSTAIYLRWGMRVGVVAFTWYFHTQPAALFLYWMGTSLGGALQPVLLRNQAFRKYFAFPDPPAAGKLELVGVRAPTMWDKLTKSKATVDEMTRVHSEKLKEAGKSKLLNIDDFEIVVNKKGTGASVNKKSGKNSSGKKPAGDSKQ